VTVDSEQELLSERFDDYEVVTLNRPERLNATTVAVVTALRERLMELDDDPGVRAIVLTGAGRAFCSGADLSGSGDGRGEAGDVLRRFYSPLIELMQSMRTPIVAAVNGAAAGAGFSLALAADLRIASSGATFVAAFVKVGYVPDSGLTWLLPRATGTTRAREIFLLGRKVTATEALDWGVVNEVVPPEEVLPRARALARELAALPASVAQIRQLLSESPNRDLTGQLAAEAAAQTAAQQHPHHNEARQAFLEKRAPKFY
jgi:2-(1,2-epoxy-1,2-dihydrophenyl)acetyl-CoA isomerase